jgi:hypothetical protein
MKRKVPANACIPPAVIPTELLFESRNTALPHLGKWFRCCAFYAAGVGFEFEIKACSSSCSAAHRFWKFRF